MNEEIDVSYCTFYVEGECDIYQDKCDKIKCAYKGYKRIEAENEKLKNKYNENVTVNTQLQKWQDEDLRQIAGLKRELEQANEWNKTLWQKLEKIKEVINECMIFKKCESCKFYKECDKNMEEYILKIIEGAEDRK